MYLNTNMAALNAWSSLQNTETQMNGVLQQLSSGFRINSAADNPSGLAISQQMQSQINGLNQGQTNAQAGASLLQTADGAMGHIESILQSMRSLASEASTSTNNANDLKDLQAQMNQYSKEITQIANTTQFNNLSLLSGAYGGVGPQQQFQIGANQGETLGVSIAAADSASLNVLGNVGTVNSPPGSNSLALATNAVTNVGAGYSGNYTVKDAYTASWTGTVSQSNASGTVGTISGNYNGSNNENIVIKVLGVSGATPALPNSIAVSTDGGLTYGSAISVASNSASIGQGLTVTFGTTNAAATGDTYSFTANTAQNSLSLTDSSGAVATGSFSGQSATDALLTGASGQGTMNVNIDPTDASGINATATTTNNGLASAPSSTTYTQSITVKQDGQAATTTGNGQLAQTDWATANSGLNIQSQSNAQAALTSLSSAIATVNQQRANIGAWENRLQFAGQQDQTMNLNLTNAQAGIRDTNMALQMSNLAKDQVLQQSGVAMLSQANQIPSALLKLLG